MARRVLIARLAAAALLLVVLVVVMAVGLGVLAYGTGPVRTGELEVSDLASRVTVGWPDDGPPLVEASDEIGLWTGLGYAHAADDAWSMTLWRQVALGNLGAWFPERGDLDRHARLLGFGQLARQTFETLPAGQRAALEAYSRGVQAAMRQPGVAQRDEFVLVDVRPERWEPWHALAIERLMAWLGTPAPGRDSAFAAAADADTALAHFARADSAFRAYLALDGFDHARAFGARVGGAEGLVVELPWGQSALPLFQEVVLRMGNRTVVAAGIPGTLALPVGHAAEGAWAVFPTSRASVAPFTGTPPPPDYDRLVDRVGDETLLTIPRSPAGLFLTGSRPAPTSPPSVVDTTIGPVAAIAPPANAPAAPPIWRIDWPGFSHGTDLPAWRALLAGGTSPAFTLFRGDGITATRAGAVSALGAPPVTRPLPGGVFVAGSPRAAYAAARLSALLADDSPDSLIALVDDTYSGWAAERLAPLVTALGDRRELEPDLRDPYAFLRGWDARYSADAIGASLFEVWLSTHREHTGALPPARPDSAAGELLRWSLRLAVRRLTTRYGPEPAAWRWERVQEGDLVFPVWASGDARRAAERYAPVRSARAGHPTTLREGPSPVAGGAAGVWTLWATSGAWDRPVVRRPEVETEGFLARARSVSREPAPRAIARDVTPQRRVTLVPARP